MFTYIDQFLADPKAMLIFFLLAFPGRILALSMHEFAHAWVANRCGDPTAKYLGRLTLNPIKHLDPIGTVMMLVLGFGWAKAVPVNPRNYRNLRRDDLLVSIAGVTTNLIMFLLGYIVLAAFIIIALKQLPSGGWMFTSADSFVTTYQGARALVYGGAQYYIPLENLFQFAAYGETITEILIQPVFGRMAGYIYQMIGYFVQVNLCLAIFNLLPVPPLDGYHVLNDLLLKRSLFASPKVARTAYGVLMLLMFTGVLGDGLGYVINFVFNSIGSGMNALVGLAGLF